jgi:hypothetical protein
MGQQGKNGGAFPGLGRKGKVETGLSHFFSRNADGLCALVVVLSRRFLPICLCF